MKDKMYIVSGYDDMCVNFHYSFDSYVEAIEAIRKLKFCVVFGWRGKPATGHFPSWL